MALHKDFPKDPYAILDPNIRWFPAENIDLLIFRYMLKCKYR